MLGESEAAARRRRARELQEDQHQVRWDEGMVAVNRALAAMPLYRRLGYPERINSSAELEGLQLLGKRTVVEARPSELLPRGLAAAAVLASGTLELVTSSGSGAAAMVWLDREDAWVLPAAAYEMMGVDQSVRHVSLLTSPICSGGACTIEGSDGFAMLPPTANVFLEGDTYFSAVCDRLASSPPTLLLTNPAILCAVLRWADLHGRRVQFSGAVVSSYQRITRTQAHFIHARLGLPIVDQYGATELAGCIVANTCSHGTPHVWSRRSWVEVVDANGGPLARGEEGEIVVTNVGASGSCLIRYRVGDSGRMSLVDCPCGVSSLALWVTGRVGHRLLYRGRQVSEADIDDALGAMPGVITWQLRQRVQGPPVLTVIAGTEPAKPEAVRAALVGKICDDVVVRYADRVECTDAQKYPPFVALDRRAFL